MNLSYCNVDWRKTWLYHILNQTSVEVEDPVNLVKLIPALLVARDKP